MVSKLAKAIGFIGGAAAVVWAMRDRFISVAVSREPEPPAFRRSSPTSDSGQGLESIDGIGPTYAGRLAAAGIKTVGDLVNAGAEKVGSVAGVSANRAGDWLDQARSM